MSKTKNVGYQRLSLEIKKMADVDQKWRSKIQAFFRRGNTSNSKFKKLQRKILAIDRKHTNKLKQIVAKYGWPTISLVGKELSDKAWILVQHADNINFQEQCLSLLKKALEKKEVSPQNFAYLSDKIKVSKNLPQIFGTQFKQDDEGNIMLFRIYKPKDIDKRRKKYGLGPLKQYTRKISMMYGNTKRGRP